MNWIAALNHFAQNIALRSIEVITCFYKGQCNRVPFSLIKKNTNTKGTIFVVQHNGVHG